MDRVPWLGLCHVLLHSWPWTGMSESWQFKSNHKVRMRRDDFSKRPEERFLAGRNNRCLWQMSRGWPEEAYALEKKGMREEVFRV